MRADWLGETQRAPWQLGENPCFTSVDGRCNQDKNDGNKDDRINVKVLKRVSDIQKGEYAVDTHLRARRTARVAMATGLHRQLRMCPEGRYAMAVGRACAARAGI